LEWQGWQREARTHAELAKAREFSDTTLAALLKQTTEVLARNTAILERLLDEKGHP
jgi:hypothetical protein